MSFTDMLPDITYYIAQFVGDTAVWLIRNPVCMIAISLFIFIFLIAQVRRLMQW